MSNKSEEKNMEPRAPFKWSKESDEKLKKLKEELKASINWSEVDKWNADGRPYEEHEEILMFLNENEFISLESNEKENRAMKEHFTQVPGRVIERPGRSAVLKLPPKMQQLPDVTTVNIVVKLLDPIKYPIQSRITERILNDLSISGLLNGVIGLNVMGRVKTYEVGTKKLNSAVNVYNIVPKDMIFIHLFYQKSSMLFYATYVVYGSER
ncbi:hypothetical protein RhiirA1_398353 [Rhizophagus irregularis]|uniref:Uncharacterized protein n=2 Tax=Rhizophagus irregularis TaxID=588596 RepID=A0A2N0RE19_9GLOM|nr:hypothetical protein GLOIN_2v1484674 [Rhizophagus irregularis DAOM 181602=DAOM 197198]PKC61528.1 hypothetical protein RhiirA1_398353 [Rhizophagus irregularis]POG63437.1 hypothetical protein GLOIN_2v1484674 [Rhizophagus irregularis DAOM 181602=DAOM 197198]|eukprot:XP_025170303.1 hypothetical protein GLOIN_2v1484674 [Rhizophagus irregularis DAOM 181602=DAOM 197198]